MRRRELIALLGGAAAAPMLSPLPGHAQRPMPVVGYLNPATLDGYVDYLRAFRQGLKESGHVEGENVAIEYRWAENEPNKLKVLADDLVRRQVNAIAVVSAPA